MIFLKLFFTFLKIGAFTFGGGYAMLPLIQQEVVSHQWMTLEQLVNFIAVSESTPGPLAVNLSTYVGAETGGLLGALCATFGVVLPSFVIILVVAKFYQAFQSNTVVKGCMTELVVLTTFFSITQYRIGFGCFFEFLFCFGIARIHIRMVLLRQCTIRLFDRSIVSILAYTKHLVIISF